MTGRRPRAAVRRAGGAARRACPASSPCRRPTATNCASPRPAPRCWRAATSPTSCSRTSRATKSRSASTGCRPPASKALSDRRAAREIWAYRIPSRAGRDAGGRRLRLGRAGVPASRGAATMAGAPAGRDHGALHRVQPRHHRRGAVRRDHAGDGGAGRLYLAARGGPPARQRWARLLFWLGLAGSVLLKGPIGPMVVGADRPGAGGLGPAGAAGCAPRLGLGR